jgi:hypothetical protein
MAVAFYLSGYYSLWFHPGFIQKWVHEFVFLIYVRKYSQYETKRFAVNAQGRILPFVDKTVTVHFAM